MMLTKPQRQLVWKLFQMVREVLPVTADNARWANEWAARFQEHERELEADGDNAA
jgi:hypothetical protein